MIDNQLIELILTWVDLYGPWALGGMMFTSAIGLPLPVTPLVLTAGALARMGYFDWSLAAIWIFVGTVVGDSLSYWIGWIAGEWAERIGGNRFASIWAKAQTWFEKYGGLAVLLSRCVFNSLDVPISLIAGASRYGFWRYLLYVLSGRFIWIALYGGLGYAFSSQYERIRDFFGQYTSWLGIALVLGILAFILLQRVLKEWFEKRLLK